jgi:hypothetical protein
MLEYDLLIIEIVESDDEWYEKKLDEQWESDCDT